MIDTHVGADASGGKVHATPTNADRYCTLGKRQRDGF